MAKNPNHIAIILDGNRRYAKKLGLQAWKGHEFGLKKLEELFDWCQELEIKELTLYAFSTENFNRNKVEIDFLFNLFKKKFEELINDKDFFKKNIRINVIGRINMFPDDIKDSMINIMDKTRNNDKLVINFAMAYGGRAEIVDATKKIIKKIKNNELKVEDINEQIFSENLYSNSEPDILIRPGGEKRISNFLLFQGAYSELFFINKLWPEFTKEDLINIIEAFKKRERRFGK